MPRLERSAQPTDDLLVEIAADKRLALLARPKGKLAELRLKILLGLLEGRGYTIYPVAESLTELAGRPAFKSFEALPEKAATALVSLPPEALPETLKLCYKADIRRVWLIDQVQANQKLREQADKLDLELLEGLPPLLYLEPVGLLFGGLRALHRRWVRSVVLGG